jgi:hypothetical protein
VGVIVNHAALLERLRAGWSPDRYHSPG